MRYLTVTSPLEGEADGSERRCRRVSRDRALRRLARGDTCGDKLPGEAPERRVGASRAVASALTASQYAAGLRPDADSKSMLSRKEPPRRLSPRIAAPSMQRSARALARLASFIWRSLWLDSRGAAVTPGVGFAIQGQGLVLHNLNECECV